MQISKPNYSIEEFYNQFNNKEGMSTVERSISSSIIDILKDSDKYLISDIYPLYLEEFEKKDYSDNHSGSNGQGSSLKPFSENISFEYFDNLSNKEVIINIIGTNHPLYEKLLLSLGKNSQKEKNSYMILYFFKYNNEWEMPVETIIIQENDKKTIIQLFPQRSFNMNNSLFSDDQHDSLQSFINGLFNIFSSIMKIFRNKKMEYINVPPLKKKKNNKNCYSYKVPHILLSKPINNLKTNQGLTMSVHQKNKQLDKDIKNIKDKLYFK